MNQLRIAIVSFQYYKRNLRLLPWRYVYEFSQQFLNLGHEVTIVTDGYPEFVKEDPIGGVPVIHLSHVKHFPPRNFKSIKKTITEIDPHVVLWQMGFTNFFQKRLYETLSYPIIALISSSIYWRREIIERLKLSEINSERNLLSTSLAETFLPKILTRSTLNSDAIKSVVSMSQENTERLKKIGVKHQKLVYIPPGIDSNFFKNPSDEEIRKNRIAAIGEAGGFLVLYLGPPLLTRGVDTLLKAIDFALDTYPHLKRRLHVLFLLRIRKGEYSVQERNVLKLFDRLKHKEVVSVKSGFLSGSEIRPYMAASDLIVFPFKHVISDFPLGVVEAMSMGKTVVCTRIDGMSELLEQGRGFLVNPGDFVNIGRILAHLPENKAELNEYGRRSRQYMLERPTWTQSSERLLELLSDVLKTH